MSSPTHHGTTEGRFWLRARRHSGRRAESHGGKGRAMGTSSIAPAFGGVDPEVIREFPVLRCKRPAAAHQYRCVLQRGGGVEREETECARGGQGSLSRQSRVAATSGPAQAARRAAGDERDCGNFAVRHASPLSVRGANRGTALRGGVPAAHAGGTDLQMSPYRKAGAQTEVLTPPATRRVRANVGVGPQGNEPVTGPQDPKDVAGDDATLVADGDGLGDLFLLAAPCLRGSVLRRTQLERGGFVSWSSSSTPRRGDRATSGLPQVTTLLAPHAWRAPALCRKARPIDRQAAPLYRDERPQPAPHGLRLPDRSADEVLQRFIAADIAEAPTQRLRGLPRAVAEVRVQIVTGSGALRQPRDAARVPVRPLSQSLHPASPTAPVRQ